MTTRAEAIVELEMSDEERASFFDIAERSFAGIANVVRSDFAKLQAELAKRDASFDLRWNADMRAIKAWQEAHPGNDLVWPDHADMCVWLMAEIARLRPLADEAGRLREALEVSGKAQVYRDGFAACVETIDSIDLHFYWGPQATLDDAVTETLRSVKQTAHRALDRLSPAQQEPKP